MSNKINCNCGKPHRIGTKILNDHLHEAIAKMVTGINPQYPDINFNRYTTSIYISKQRIPTPGLPVPLGEMGQQPFPEFVRQIQDLRKEIKEYPAGVSREVRYADVTEDTNLTFEQIVEQYREIIKYQEQVVESDNSKEDEIRVVRQNNDRVMKEYNNILKKIRYPAQAFRLTISTERPSDANWTNSSRSLPRIPEIKQEDRAVEIFIREGYSSEYPAKCEASTSYNVSWSEDGKVCKISGNVSVKNFKKWQGTGVQDFVYFIFVGDDNRLYAHRATATKGWYDLAPADFYAKIKKYKTAIQQGDMLFVPANGDAKDIKFEHEVSNFGEHKLEFPVLASQGYIKVDSPISVTHRTHPTITLTPRVYRVTTTQESLRIPMHTRID